MSVTEMLSSSRCSSAPSSALRAVRAVRARARPKDETTRAQVRLPQVWSARPEQHLLALSPLSAAALVVNKHRLSFLLQ